jgi:hypothetical protein
MIRERSGEDRVSSRKLEGLGRKSEGSYVISIQTRILTCINPAVRHVPTARGASRPMRPPNATKGLLRLPAGCVQRPRGLLVCPNLCTPPLLRSSSVPAPHCLNALSLPFRVRVDTADPPQIPHTTTASKTQPIYQNRCTTAATH